MCGGWWNDAVKSPSKGVHGNYFILEIQKLEIGNWESCLWSSLHHFHPHLELERFK